MIVLDANILIRAVWGRRVRTLLEDYSGRGIRFYAPDIAYADAEKYLPPLLAQRGKPTADVTPTLQYLQTLVEPVDAESYGLPKRTPGSVCGVGTRRIGRSLLPRWL